MKKTKRLKFIVLTLLCVTAFLGMNAQSNDLPNILWLVIEDTSPQNIGCYGNAAVNTPNIDQLAAEGVRFANAYSTGTSCAPSRSTIITGVRTYKMGTGNQRTTYPIPDMIKGFPYYLKQAGYYTSNNSKTDYNTSNAATIIENSWDESSNSAGWWNRQAGQPFFSVFNYASSHQSRTMTESYDYYVENVLDVLPDHLEVGENDFDMPPYLADTPEMRMEYARMYNGISLTDYNIGKRLQALEDAGLKDNTIIFFYADHGQGMPRQKTNGIGQGYKVPFVVWFPEMYKHLSPFGTGGVVTSEQINFADLAATILSLAGIEAPEYFDGRAFLGTHRAAAPEYMFVSNDRVDNGVNVNRAVIKENLIYVRNFTPFQPEQRYINYFIKGEICKLMYEDFISDNLSAQQSFLFEKRTPEAFYNLNDDMWEMNNLIDDPAYADEIAQMRSVLEQNILQSKDIMLAPEYDYKRLPGGTTPYEYRLTAAYNMNEIWQAASLSGFTGDDVKQQQLQFLGHQNDLVRYWAAVGLMSQTVLSSADLEVMATHLNDSYEPAKIYLAAAIYENNKSETAKSILEDYSLSTDPDLSLMAIELIQNMESFKDFGDHVLKVYNETSGVSSLWATWASADVLMYRLKAENFAFNYGASTITEQVITDFETPINVVPASGAAFSVVQNTEKSAINQTNNCGQLKRTSTNWWELIDIPCNFSIAADEVAYLHVLVKYPAQPDVVVRLNSMGNEMNLRTIHEYDALGEWQDLVFILPGGSSGLNVTNIRYMDDCGFQNSPSGFVLDNLSKFGYIDEIIVNNSSARRSISTSTKTVEIEKDYSLIARDQFITFQSHTGQNRQFEVYDLSGKRLFSANKIIHNFRVPKSGIYIVRIGNAIEKIFVQ
ncbi:sulfatase-like hydrolase/transferase [Carboxylicivirga sp. A043]|uniref:sulfatase-like hydrolase/transferase n=1 Tax=Carboxylicivirga litoralis TaxID=2816963 RepID=UPI0021CB060E|nr:sulfatase-like hydrolase/transferase [Carboxylicivirga sp. A043]MCU4157761.1 sulfatase-like hydrolase/transferase [Carboxylicivirga sp. A043]